MSESMAKVAVKSTAVKSAAVNAPVQPAARRPHRRAAGRFAALAAPILVAAVAGCASYGKPVNQEVALRVTEGGERAEANCVVSNDLGTWSVVAPVVLGVTRSEKPLEVECSTPEGLKAVRVFTSIRFGELPGGQTAYAYPEELELALARPDRLQTTGVSASAFARIDDVAMLPYVDDEGREGYRRFLAGGLPRAFAISDNGHWIRVNAARGAARLAMSRCQTYGGRCRLYAVDDDVVWDQKRPSDLVASY
jgi:hypothetical protein